MPFLLPFGLVEMIDLFLIHFLMIVVMKRVIGMRLDQSLWGWDALEILQMRIHFCTDLQSLRFQEKTIFQRECLKERGDFVECIEENVK